MKNKLNLSFLIVFIYLISCTPLLAEISKNNFFLGLTVDGTYIPESEPVQSDGDHFAPISGPLKGGEARGTLDFNYTLPTPLGNHWLLNDANLAFGSIFELTPITAGAGIYLRFTPFPFLILESGAFTGTGWPIGTLYGTAKFNNSPLPDECGYDPIDPFQAYLYKWYGQGTLQFDTGVIWAGDWTHVQIQYTYQAYFEGLTTIEGGDVWMWQNGGNKTRGWSNYQQIILAYQMPLVLSRVGVMTELEGHYYNSDYYLYYFRGPGNGSFKKVTISPLLQFSFSPRDTFSTLFSFSSRRGYSTKYENTSYEPFLMFFSGREWFFYRVALRWNHNF